MWPRIRPKKKGKKSREERNEARERTRGQDEPKIEESSPIPRLLGPNPEIKTETEEVVAAQPAASPSEWSFYGQALDSLQYVWIAYPYQQIQWNYPSI